jgi:Zn-dependent protease with chaperone function
MPTQHSGRDFELSPDQVDFGIAGPGDRPVRSVSIINRSRSSASVRIRRCPAWVKPRLAQRANNKCALELVLDASQLPGSGSHSDVMELRIGTSEFSISLMVTAAGVRPTSHGAASHTGAGSAGVSGPRTKTGHAGALGPGSSGIVSVGITGIVLLMIFGSLYQLLVHLFAGTEGGTMVAGLVTGGLGLIYVAVAAWKACPPGHKVLNPRSLIPDHKRLFCALGQVCNKAGLPLPRVVLRQDDRPNLVSLGLTYHFSCLYVNQGLLSVLGNKDELAAAVAHEIGHLRNGDHFYFLFLRPTLKAIYAVLGGIRAVLFQTMTTRRRGGSMSPFGAMMMMHGISRMGIWGLLFLMMFVLVAIALLVICGALALCLTYSQYLEKRADLEAARIVDNPDAVLIALARCVDHYPTEIQYMNAFAAQHLANPDDYALDDIVRAIKDGARIHTKVTWMDRYLRSHPLVLFRIENIVKAAGSNLT